MEVLLTGGTGFFGKALLRYWKEEYLKGCPVPDVTVLSRSPEKFLSNKPGFVDLPWLRWHRGDILVPASLPEGGNFTHILHAAADSTLGDRLSPIQRYEQIVNGTRNLLEFAARHKTERFLFVSSGGVYGPQPQDMEAIVESYAGMANPLDANNAYCVAKRCGEHLCALFQQQFGIETIIARCFAFVGPDLPRDVHFAIGNFIRDALSPEKTEIVVKGDGTPVRSYLDQRDLALWLYALLRMGRAGEAYNVGSQREITIRDLAYIVRDALAPEKAVRIASASIDNNFRNRYVPSTRKIESELGLSERYSLLESIRYAALN